MTHLQIIDDQVQVVTDAHEVLYLNLHLVDHVMKRGDVVLTRKDITLQFFDLVGLRCRWVRAEVRAREPATH